MHAVIESGKEDFRRRAVATKILLCRFISFGPLIDRAVERLSWPERKRCRARLDEPNRLPRIIPA